MGFSSLVVSPPSTNTGRYGLATGPVHAVILLCAGNEKSLFECVHTPWDDSEYVDEHCCDVEISCMPGKFSGTVFLFCLIKVRFMWIVQ